MAAPKSAKPAPRARIGRPPAGTWGDTDMKSTIVRIAREQFSRNGYDGVSIREIAEECGVTAAALHYYFKSKANLYAECHRDTLQTAAERGEATAATAAPVVDRLRQIAFDHVNDAFELFDLWVQLPNQQDVLEDYMTELVHWRRAYVQVIERLVAEGRDDGTFRTDMNPRRVAHHFIGALNHVPRWSSQAKADAVVDEFMALILGGLSLR